MRLNNRKKLLNEMTQALDKPESDLTNIDLEYLKILSQDKRSDIMILEDLMSQIEEITLTNFRLIYPVTYKDIIGSIKSNNTDRISYNIHMLERRVNAYKNKT